MKEASATSTIFRLVLAFTLLFAGFLSVAIVYNKAYRLKNESLAIIEKYEGINNNSLKIINNYLKLSGYTTKSKCETGEYGIKDLNSNNMPELVTQGSNTEYYYCLSYYCSQKNCNIKNALNGKGSNEIFYKFKLFFKFELPFLGDLSIFKITGETKGINLYSENQKLK